MLTYFTTGSNNWTIRTSPIASSSVSLSLDLQDMFLLKNKNSELFDFYRSGILKMRDKVGADPMEVIYSRHYAVV